VNSFPSKNIKNIQPLVPNGIKIDRMKEMKDVFCKKQIEI
jgi:hypothetical protein